jgi:hypothetical protein
MQGVNDDSPGNVRPAKRPEFGHLLLEDGQAKRAGRKKRARHRLALKSSMRTAGAIDARRILAKYLLSTRPLPVR